MKLQFSTKLYSREAVEMAAADFAELASFRVSEKGEVIEVEANPEKEAEVGENFAEEFSNYVLGQMG